MYVRAGIPTSVVMSESNAALVKNLMIYSVSLLVAFFSSWLIGKKYIIDRVLVLQRSSQRLADGDLRTRVAHEVGGGELGKLGQAFDNMAQKLALREQALRESENNYRDIFNATHDALFVRDAESGAIIEVNNAAERMFGYTCEEMLHVTVPELSGVEPPYSSKDAMQWVQKSIQKGPQKFEWLSKRKNGELFWSEVVLSASSIVGKRRVLAVVRDITERKQAEEENRKLNASLQQQTLDLIASNRELEACSYTLSHDLRSPLTSIYTAGQLLKTMYGEELDENGKILLHSICDGSEHMEELIEAILGLFGAARSEMHADEVNLSEIAASITVNLHLNAPERGVEFVIAPGVTATCDHRLIKVVLENLLGNAWKYSWETPAPRIEFGVTGRDGETVYYVRDNGAGFDMKDADELFSPFKRLHASGKFPGTGIGLATVQRIVERHGGKVWAEGETGKGATFYFTLC